MSEMLVSATESGKTSTDDSLSLGSPRLSHLDYFESDDDYRPSGQLFLLLKEDDASSVGSLDDSHPEDVQSEDADDEEVDDEENYYAEVSEEDDEEEESQDDEEEEDDKEKESQTKVAKGSDIEWDTCKLPKEEESQDTKDKLEWDTCKVPKEEESQDTVDTLRQLMDYAPEGKENERYYGYIYGYYRKLRAYGGYGIILLDKSRKQIGAYTGASSGGSYIYHLLVGIKRGLQIASERGLPTVKWSINSHRAAVQFNYIFRYPCMLRCVFHSKRDAADVNFCNKCMRRQMWLPVESFKVLVPVIKDIIKLQYEIKFRYREDCDEIRNHAAYYVAKCGAKVLEKKIKLGTSSDVVQEVEIKMDFPERLSPIVESGKKLLEYIQWNVLQREQEKPDIEIPRTELPDA